MANLAYQQARITGEAVELVAASAGGDTVSPNLRGALMVVNDDAASHDVTITVPGNTRYGQAQPDVTVTVAAGTTALLGPFPQDLADPVTGLVSIGYAAVTGMSVAAVTI